MGKMLLFGARVLLEVVKASMAAETRRNEEAHKRDMSKLLECEFARLQQQGATRVQERRAALEQMRLVSSDHQWQKRIDQILEMMDGVRTTR